MFPNPQDALPLPQKPNVEQYRKLAKELVREATTGEDAIRHWAKHWITALVRQSGIVITRNLPVRIESWSNSVAISTLAFSSMPSKFTAETSRTAAEATACIPYVGRPSNICAV